MCYVYCRHKLVAAMKAMAIACSFEFRKEKETSTASSPGTINTLRIRFAMARCVWPSLCLWDRGCCFAVATIPPTATGNATISFQFNNTGAPPSECTIVRLGSVGASKQKCIVHHPPSHSFDPFPFLPLRVLNHVHPKHAQVSNRPRKLMLIWWLIWTLYIFISSFFSDSSVYMS